MVPTLRFPRFTVLSIGRTLGASSTVLSLPMAPLSSAILSYAMGGKVRIFLATLVFLVTATMSQAQWDIQDSHTSGSLRGIHNVGGGVAWASGTNGTVLRTLDDGKRWQTCPIPLADTKDTAEKLDFRGIQALDAQTAIVMSSGPGDQSRLYKTTDGCQTWKLVFTNPDKDGFWDALLHSSTLRRTIILGDPVNSHFRMFVGDDDGDRFYDIGSATAPATPGESAFAASNSNLITDANQGLFAFVTGGARSEMFHEERGENTTTTLALGSWTRSRLPFVQSSTSGAFSIASTGQIEGNRSRRTIVVGGDYKYPEIARGTAVFSMDFGRTWKQSVTPPHGYRSAVAYDSATKTWITVGPNGTDISTDDGRNWRPLTPGPGEDKDADKNWNALSLPFVVGPRGRIGRLRANAAASIKPPREEKP